MNTKLVARAILTIGAIALTSAAVAGAPQALAGAGHRHGLRAGRYPHGHRTRGKLGSCTMAEPQAQATVEVVIPDASDFCELVSKVLATDVFHAPVSVMQGRLWHYDDATLSCLLQYRNTRDRAASHNSVAACSWFRRLSPGWHIQARRAHLHPQKELDPRTLSKISAALQGFIAWGGDANGRRKGAVVVPLLSPR